MGNQSSDGKVTKAQTWNSNKVPIRCNAGGKSCDAEMARQPRLVRDQNRDGWPRMES